MKRWLLLLFVVVGNAFAQPFPSKPVKMVIPFSAGGLTDVLGRGLGQELTKMWDRPVIVENRPGANTIIAAEYVAKQPADGYTLLMANDPTLSSNQYLYNKLPYDPVKDFAPVVNLVTTTTVLIATPSLPANNLPELLALAKKKPGELTYGTFGLGSATHLDTEAFASTAGVKFTHVPYKGIADVIPAVMSGQINMALSGMPPALPHIRSGKLKAIAFAGAQRSALLPDVPTFAEGGIPNFEARSWFGLVAPAGTPRAVIDKIAGDVAKVLAQPEFREKFVTGVGLEPLVQNPEQFAEFLRKDREKYAVRVKNVNVKLD
jgi:tripartite-type tricarboxylate transporter receptor subunit TctC